MLQLSQHTRYWLYRHHTDMRKGFDSLCGIVSNQMRQDALSGDVFVFVNRRRTHVKLLIWEGDGLALYYKRLEKGAYELPLQSKDGSINLPACRQGISAQQLMLMLHGISLRQVKYRKRYQHIG
jgi:transposase